MKNLFVLLCALCALSLAAEEGATKPAATAPADAAKETTVKAEAGCGHCTFAAMPEHSAAIKVGEVIYVVKLADNAPEATRKLVATLPEMKGPPKIVKVVGRPTQTEAVIAKADHKVYYYEIGEMSLQE